tara:strand:- start:3461 stop:3853 length:393 start_codon:yes stop_codon:yes gene_type:complete
MSILIHLPNKKTYNNNIELIEIHILFNVNDKSVDNIEELNNILKYCKAYDINFQINTNKFYKTWNKLKKYIDDTKSNAVFLFCQHDKSHLLFLQQNQNHIICFTEKIQKMTNIDEPFIITNQGAGGLKTT